MLRLSSMEWPKEIDGGGRGTYCCVPQYKSASHDRDRKKTETGFFKFPTNHDLRRTWTTVMKQIKTTVFCEFPFKPEEINVSSGIGRKPLDPDTIPSVFKFKESNSSSKRNSPRKRPIEVEPIIEESSESEFEDDSEDDDYYY